MRRFIPNELYNDLYHTLYESHLTYGISVWGALSKNRLDPIFKTQKKCIRILFGDQEGRIALANRRKDPLFLFAALQRQLNYPKVPRPVKADPDAELLPRMVKMVEQLKTRVKLLEDEQRDHGIDLSQFYGGGQPPHPRS